MLILANSSSLGRSDSQQNATLLAFYYLADNTAVTRLSPSPAGSCCSIWFFILVLIPKMSFTQLVETRFQYVSFPLIQSAAEGSHFSGLTMAGGLCHTVMILHYRWIHRMAFLDTDAFLFLFLHVSKMFGQSWFIFWKSRTWTRNLRARYHHVSRVSFFSCLLPV